MFCIPFVSSRTVHVHVRERKSPRISITEKGCLNCTVARAQFGHLHGQLKVSEKA